jgi:formylglycine-generating enzyme required for sulfatase activity
MATTIYLSSTYEDLKEYRQAVFDALRKSQYTVKAMEDYVATDQRPVDKCLKDVEQADIYVGLFAFRYGYIPPASHNNPDNLSITELELRHAERLKKPCLTFLADHKTPGIPQQFVDSFTGDGESGQQIKRLREYLGQERTRSLFSGPYQLASLVQAAVASHLADNDKPASSTVSEPATSLPVTWDIKKKGSPYPGLMNFTPEYAPVFFGRDLEVREILDRMHLPEGRFILVSGDSGVGKSSVIAAGVLQVIEKRGLPGGEHCEILHMLPGRAQQPWASLMMAGLGAMVTRAGLTLDDVLEELPRDPKTLTGHLNTIIKKGSNPHALLLFLDQMEELFTFQEITQSNQFLTALYHAAQEGVLWIVATIRSDHLHYCHRHDAMVKVLGSRGHYPLRRVDRVMMHEMIVKPAQCAGLSISERLARRLIDDTEEDAANLPLLAFVLQKLFEDKKDHELSESVYKDIGGVGGAIRAHVKTIEGKIQNIDEVLPRIFQTLVNLKKVREEGGVPTRNRPLVTGFEPHLRKALGVLVAGRLLRTEGEGEAATVSISHEKLFEVWPALQDYVKRHEKLLVDRTILESRARKWQEIGKPWFSGLVSGREYKELRRAGIAATPLIDEYLSTSRWARWLLNGVIGVVVVMILGTTWLWQKGYSVEQAMLKVESFFVSIHLSPEMQTVAGGTFQQGDIHGRGGPEEQPVHEVKVKPFAIGKFEVTFEEYDRFAIAAGRPLPPDQGWGRGRRPVINVSWHDAKKYADWLSRQMGRRFRLPTESEWEYAARSEGKEDIWAGTSDEQQLKNYAVYGANPQRRTAPVGQEEGRKPNALGLYDMSGNVWEWVEDCQHGNYDEAPTDGTAWLEGGGRDCGEPVLRGGSWFYYPGYLRASSRTWTYAGSGNNGIGFRLAQDLAQ